METYSLCQLSYYREWSLYTTVTASCTLHAKDSNMAYNHQTGLDVLAELEVGYKIILHPRYAF